jgi:hypothetical protein
LADILTLSLVANALFTFKIINVYMPENICIFHKKNVSLCVIIHTRKIKN